MRAKAKEKHWEHYEVVRRIVPRERLLEYKLGSGWEPLCNFLGKEVPDVEFPKVNDMASTHENDSIIFGRGVRNSLTRFLLWTGPLIVAVLLVAARYRWKPSM